MTLSVHCCASSSLCLYEWVSDIESFNQLIQSGWFIQEQNKQPCLQVSHWIIYSANSFKTPHSLNDTSDCCYQWATESFIQLICAEIIQEQIEQLFMSESLNYTFNQFIQNP